MTLLVFGSTGQVARELVRLRPEAVYLDRHTADFTVPAACAQAVADHEPDAIIIAAAFTAVDAAEADSATAHCVNAGTPGAIASAAAKRGVPVVYISSDYVFDGRGAQPFRPGDPTGPLNAYGASKLAGERAVQEAGGPHAILRTSWVFSAHGANFVKTMLRLSETRTALSIVDDQIGGPTPAADLAAACLSISDRLVIRPEATGIYHLSGAPDVSWADFAREIFRQAGREVTVTGIASKDYPTPARRPLNGRLDCSAVFEVFEQQRPDWRARLGRVLVELGVL